MALMRAAVGGRIVGRLRSRLVWPERDRVTRALHPLLSPLARRCYSGFSFLSQRFERLGRVDIDEDGIVVHLDFSDELGMLANQMLCSDIAGELGHLREEPLCPQDRITTFPIPGRDDDRATFKRVERRNQ